MGFNTYFSTFVIPVVKQRNTNMSKFLLSCLLLLWFSWAQAQTLYIKGENMKPLEGASVAIENNGEGVVSGANGIILLNFDAPTSIIISYVGYESRRLKIKPKEERTIILKPQSKNLNEVTVEGFNQGSVLKEQAGSISKISAQDLLNFDPFSPVAAINSVPGIRFEQRAAASYRISIRGSSVRSPFGIRNVKVYWNDIPFTDPGGNTFLNMLDMSNMGSMEIIKGPAGSLYGAGNGGVIKIRSTDWQSAANSNQLKTTVGSFGSFHTQLQSTTVTDTYASTFKYAHQEADGYRDHNAMKRSIFEWDGLFFADENRTYNASFLYSDLFYEIPGGLNASQMANNRRQARPGSEAQNASIDQQLFLLKVGQEYQLSNKYSNNIQANLTYRQFENPFILDYKKDNEQGFGVLSTFQHNLNTAKSDLFLQYGMEFQVANFDGKNFGNRNGRADTLRFADELTNQQTTIFTQIRWAFQPSFSATAGASYNRLSYNIDRVFDAVNGSPSSFQKKFNDVFRPRLTLNKTWTDEFSTHLSVSSGFSPPTTSEVRTNEGSINEALQAEKGINYELNLRGSAFQKRISFDVALFHFQLDESITTFTNPQGVVLFRNAGKINQYGVEAQLQWQWLPEQSQLKWSSDLSYTYHDFKFAEFQNDGENFSGNALTGTAPHVLNISTDLNFKKGFFARANYYYSDEIPLNDANTVFSESYGILHLKWGYASPENRKVSFRLSMGIDNLLDEEYSLGNDLNAFGQRYFQPAAGRSYYVSLALRLNH